MSFNRASLTYHEPNAGLGLVLQFWECWTLMIMLAGSVFIDARAAFEERVLVEEYSACRTRTPCFITGIL